MEEKRGIVEDDNLVFFSVCQYFRFAIQDFHASYARSLKKEQSSTLLSLKRKHGPAPKKGPP